MTRVLWLLLAVVIAGLVLLFVAVRKRNAHIWLPAYLCDAGKRRRQRTARIGKAVDVMVAVVDHFEPVLKPHRDPQAIAGAMDDWMARYPALCARHRDADDRPPRHTWAFPIETYDPSYIDQLVELSKRGLGEVEVQFHHTDDTSDTFRAKMLDGLAKFARHGVSVVDGISGYRFGFVHGNWALDNSRPDGKWCGVNDEIRILRELGCFVDATLPSAPSPTQTHKINSIYYATDDPARPKSHDRGVNVAVGGKECGDLMLIQGPLQPDWSSGILGLPKKIDNAAITGPYPVTPFRIMNWLNCGISVVGRPEWIFIKLHCHGALTIDRDALVGAKADDMFSAFESICSEKGYRLHYVTLREMYNIVKAAEVGRQGNPNDLRDFAIPTYSCLNVSK